MRLNTLMLACMVAWLALAAPARAATELELLQALPIDGAKNFQASGLTLYRGELYAVSDKHSATLFRMDVSKTRARAIADRSLRAPPLKGIRGMDWEGITCDARGNFFLISEHANRILKVPAAGGSSEWLTANLKHDAAVRNAGFMRLPNAGFEALALAESGHFFLGAERHPRGIVEVLLQKKKPAATGTCARDR